MITTILFDLDGTLLPMDQDIFLKEYMGGMCAKFAAHGYEPKKLMEIIWKATAAMMTNSGNNTNEAVLWTLFADAYGETAVRDKPLFDSYYTNEFQLVRNTCGFDSQAAQTIKKIKDMGFRVALATNPLFPAMATHSRIRWAGLEPEDFELVTTYENSSRCKPNPQYFQDVMNVLNITSEECIMVGNDTLEDMAAAKLGIPVFFLTHSLINKNHVDIENYPHGDFSDLLDFIRGLNL